MQKLKRSQIQRFNAYICIIITAALIATTSAGWSMPVFDMALRPLAVDETNETSGVSGNEVHRRHFLEMVIAGVAGLVALPETAEPEGTQQSESRPAEVVPTKDPTEIIRDIHVRERIMLANSGLSIWPGFLKFYSKTTTVQRGEGYKREKAQIEAEEGLRFAQAQERLLIALGNYAGTEGKDAKTKAWQHLIDTIDSDSPDSYFAAGIAYWQAEAALEEKMAQKIQKELEEGKAGPLSAATSQRILDGYLDMHTINAAKLSQMRAMRDICRDLILAGSSLPSFKTGLSSFLDSVSVYTGYRDTLISAWDSLPPAISPGQASGEKKNEAVDRIKDNLKSVFEAEIKSLEAQNRTRSRDLAINRGLLNRRGMPPLELEAIEKEVTSYNEINSAQIALLKEQIEVINRTKLELAIPDSRQLAASLDLWNRRIEQAFTNLGVIKNLMNWTTEKEKTLPGIGLYMIQLKHEKFDEEFSLGICKILSESNSIIRELDSHYRAIGFAVPLPKSLEPLNGFVDFQRFVEPTAIPIDRPLTSGETKEHSAKIKSLQDRYLELRIQLKEKVAAERKRQAERDKRLADDTSRIREAYAKKAQEKAQADEESYQRRYQEQIAQAANNERLLEKIELSRKRHQEDVRSQQIEAEDSKKAEDMRHQASVEDADDELMLADIEKQEAAVIAAEREIISKTEGTPEHFNAKIEYEAAVVTLLQKRLSRIRQRMPQVKWRAERIVRHRNIKWRPEGGRYVVTEEFGGQVNAVEREYYNNVLTELRCAYNQQKAQIDLFEDLRALGAPLGYPDFTPSGMVTIESLDRLVKEGSQRAEFCGYIKETGPDGKEMLRGAITAGKISLGAGKVKDTSNGRFGENVIYKQIDEGWTACSQYIKVHCERLLDGLKLKDSMGDTYIEVGNLVLGLETAASECQIIGMEGFYTIDDQNILLGLDPKDPSKLLVANTLYMVEKKENIHLRDGRIITRFLLVPKKVIVRSVANMQSGFEAAGTAKEGEPILDGTTYEVEKRGEEYVTARPINTRNGPAEIIFHTDPLHPEKHPEAEAKRITKAAQEHKVDKSLGQSVLRPLSLEETNETSGTHSDEVHRRRFLEIVGAFLASGSVGIFGNMGNAAERPAQQALIVATSPYAENIRRISERQARILRRDADFIYLQQTKVGDLRYLDKKYRARLADKGFITRSMVDGDELIELTGEAKIAKKQKEILYSLADYLTAQDEKKKSEAWKNLIDAVDNCLVAEIEYWEAETGREATRVKGAFWAQKDIEPEARLAQAREMRNIYKDLRSIDSPLLLFRIIPVGPNMHGVWDQLPPVLNPHFTPSAESNKALDRIKSSLKKCLAQEIRIIEQKKKKNDEEYIERAQVANSHIDLLREQIKAIDNLGAGHDALQPKALAQLGSIIGLWRARLEKSKTDLASTKRMLNNLIKSPRRDASGNMFAEWSGAIVKESFMKELEGLELSDAFTLKIVDVLLESNQALQKMNAHYQAMGYAVPFPQTLEPVRDFLDFQQFMPAEAVPLDRPLTAEGIKIHSDGLKDCHKRLLASRITLKEMLAQARSETARANEDRRVHDVSREAWIPGGMEQEAISRLMARAGEDAEDERNLAKISMIEAKVSQLELDLCDIGEGTPQYTKVSKDCDEAIMAVLTEKHKRLQTRIDQLSKRGANYDAKVYYEVKELECLRDDIADQMECYKELLKMGCHLTSTGFAPGATYTLGGLQRVANGDLPAAKLAGYIKEAGPDGKEILKGVITIGRMALGAGEVKDTCDGKFGKGAIYQDVTGGVAPGSQYIKIDCRRNCEGIKSGDSIGETYVEMGSPVLGRETAAGEYQVIGMEGFYTIDDQNILLGLDPDNPSKLLVANIIYMVEKKENIRLRDGRVISRFQLVPKKVIVRSVASMQSGFEYDGKTKEGEPVLDGNIYEIEKRGEDYSTKKPIKINTGDVEIILRTDPLHPEKHPEAEVRRIAEAAQGHKVGKNLGQAI